MGRRGRKSGALLEAVRDEESSSRPQESVSVALLKALQADGLDHVFGVPGGYLMPFMAAMRSAGITAVPSRHEGAAAFAACGYAQASGKFGFVYGQSGPGVLNIVTAAAAAHLDSVPLLILASQSPLSQYAADGHQETTGGNHGLDQLASLQTSVGKTLRPPTAESVVRSARRALAVALGNRCPAVLEVGADLLLERTNAVDPSVGRFRSDSRPVDLDEVSKAAALIDAADSPVLLVGSRCSHRQLTSALVAICERQDIPLVTVDYAKGVIPEDHPLSAGVLGISGQEGVEDFVESSDLVISLGTRITMQTSCVYNPKLFNRLIQVDEIHEEIGRNYPVELGIVGDLAATVEAFQQAFEKLPARKRDGTKRVLSLRTKNRIYDEKITEVSDPDAQLSTPQAMRVLRSVLPRSARMVGDSGLNLQYLKRHFPVYQPDGFYALYALAAMGSALPMAMGVQVAEPDAPVVCMIGDGGFLVYAGELQAMVQAKLPVLCIVVDNAGYKQVSDRMDTWMDGSLHCDIGETDYAAVAQAFGCEAYRARTSNELKDAVTKALAVRKPTVIHLRVEGDHLTDVMSRRLKAFTEDLSSGK